MMKRFDTEFDYVDEFIDHWNEKVKLFRICCFALSIIMLVIGALCFLYPKETFTIVQCLGAIVLVAMGIYHIVTYMFTTTYFKDGMEIVIGVMNILMGYLLFSMPVVLTASALTLILAVLLMFSGAQKISFANKMRYFRIMDTGLIMFSGMISIILSVIFLIMPLASALAMNYVVAAYLIVNGCALFVEAIAMKQLKA